MDKLDQEWVKLILEVKALGLNIREVENFILNQPKQTAKETSLK